MNAVHTTKTVTPTANTNVSNLGGSPPINRTAYGQMGTAPVQEFRGAYSPRDDIQCGKKGNPICGDPVKRAARLTAAQRGIDETARSFLDQLSPDAAFAGQTIREAAPSLEHGALIIRRADGSLRFGTITTGTDSSIKYDFSGIQKNERVVGLIHTHPFNGYNFSRLDLNTANRLANINRGNFFGSYITYESESGGFAFKIFETAPAPGAITVVP
jgi:hypothetical protein